jgi:NAD(P)-dependent dehydrogenase (short-subunit alcohol dehydrogenase family)
MSLAIFDLSGRVAIVTGAAQGMGRAIAIGLAEAGADLLLVDINTTGVEATAGQIQAMGRRCIPVTADITDIQRVREVFSLLDREFGQIDVLVNVYGPGFLAHPEEIELDQFAKVIHGLVTARFCACQEGGRRMLPRGRGSIINFCSIAGVTALGRGNFAYSVGMGAVAQMTRELSTEWSGRGVRVNAILPAQVINPGLDERMAADPNLKSTFLRGLPIGRMGVPDDVKGLAIFLASDASSWITGTLIPMDGGNLAMNAGGTAGPRSDDPIARIRPVI